MAAVPIVLTGQLDPASDSGISDSDGITNVTQPIFDGTSEALSTVSVYAQLQGGGPQQLLGQTVADATGAWSLQSAVALADGSYTVIAQAQANDGVTTAQTQILPAGTEGPLVIDTLAPVVTDVVFSRLSGSVFVTFQDNLSGLAQATVVNAANYRLNKLVGRKLGQILSTAITTSGPTAPEVVKITVNGGRPIRGGQYLLRILPGGITDVAGNALNTAFYGTFPSGIGKPGSTFSAVLSAKHNQVSPLKPVSNAKASAKSSAKPAPHPKKVSHLLPIGSISNGRQVVNHLSL